MHTGGNKRITKTVKTKYKKNREDENKVHDKRKHHDKSFYRLVKEEKNEYVL